MISKCLSSDLKEDGILICLVHPGWVQTDIGGRNAKLSTKESVEGEITSFNCHFSYFSTIFLINTQINICSNHFSAMIKLILRMKPEDSGKFWNYNGDELPW